jgi:hypothetical protein
MSNEKITFSKEGNTVPELNYDDLLAVLKDNRERVRTLANIVISVDGLLFSSSLVILFFSLENNTSKLPLIIITLFAVGLVGLLISVYLGILAILLPPPKIALDKFELVNLYTAIYQREYKIIRLSAAILFISMFIFAAAMIYFLILVA